MTRDPHGMRQTALVERSSMSVLGLVHVAGHAVLMLLSGMLIITALLTPRVSPLASEFDSVRAEPAAPMAASENSNVTAAEGETESQDDDDSQPFEDDAILSSAFARSHRPHASRRAESALYTLLHPASDTSPETPPPRA